MNISVRNFRRQISFKDLDVRDVFFLAKDLTDLFLNSNKIYMKFEETSGAKMSINLSTGYVYGFDNSEPVFKCKATLTIEEYKG